MIVESIESEIAIWREFIEQRSSVDERDVDELEDHLRGQIDDLIAAGLAVDEAFLVAVKRIGKLDELAQEFARENSGGLWRQLVVGDTNGSRPESGWREMLAFAVATAVAVQVARLAAVLSDDEPWWLLRNASLLVLPLLAGYFARRRKLTARQVLIGAAPIALLAVVINVYPFAAGGFTELLVATHLPVLLWFLVANPYTGGNLRSHERRMDFVRFSGEWFIYYVLIALGGGVLTALAALILEPTGVDIDQLVAWVLPSGAAGGVVVAAWLVESKQHVIENMAPVLTMIFTPLFALMLTVATVAYALTGLGAAFDRELLGIFDTLLVVVLGLVLYWVSAREPASTPGWMDRIQLIAVIGALLLDVVVLGAMIGRIGPLGFTPNRAAALGLNVLLLVSLAGTAWFSGRFLAGRDAFHRIERWQTTFLPAFAVWAGIVVLVLPVVFAFE